MPLGISNESIVTVMHKGLLLCRRYILSIFSVLVAEKIRLTSSVVVLGFIVIVLLLMITVECVPIQFV